MLGLLTSLWAEYRHVALREWRTVILGSAGLYAAIRISGPQRGRLLTMIDIALVSSAGVALYALLRYPTAAGVIEAEGVRRARAFYGSPNNLALYLERMLPVALGMLLAGRTRWRRWLYGGSAALIGGVLALTFSRGALLIGVPVGLMVVALAQGKRARWIVLALVVLLAAIIVPMAGTERFASLLDTQQGTTAVRLSLWQSSWQMALDHPWLGIGPDNFLYYYGDYILPAGMSEPWLSHPHNLLLDFWLRLGLGGLVLLVLLLAGMLEAWRRARRHAISRDHGAVLAGLLAGTAAGAGARHDRYLLFRHRAGLLAPVRPGLDRVLRQARRCHPGYCWLCRRDAKAAPAQWSRTIIVAPRKSRPTLAWQSDQQARD